MSWLQIEGRIYLYAYSADLWNARPHGLSDEEFQHCARLVAETKNLIVTSGLEWVSRKLGHVLGTPPVQVGGETVSDIDDLIVSKIKLGNAAAPATPDPSDTDLSDPSPLLTLSSLVVSYPSSTRVRFSSTVAPDTINGSAVTEIGLFCTINATDIMIGRGLPSPVTVIVPSTAYTVFYEIVLTAS